MLGSPDSSIVCFLQYVSIQRYNIYVINFCGQFLCEAMEIWHCNKLHSSTHQRE